jgi:hypothetical protein
MLCTFSAAAFYLFISFAHAQAASPLCSDTGDSGVPICGGDVTVRVKPIALERVFVDSFSNGIAWSRTGYVASDAGTPPASTRAALLCRDGVITKDIPLANKGNHVFITFRMGAYCPETKEDPGRLSSAPLAESSVARPVPPAMRAEYHDGTAWLPLATTADGPVNENRERDAYAFYLPSLTDPSRFKLRFRIEGSDAKDCGYVDDVAVWTARVVPPPSPAPR